MDIIGLRKTAREHIVAQLTASDPSLCLPQASLSKDAWSTSLEALVELLDLSDPDEDRQQVRTWDHRKGKYDLTQ